jgi:uncharacterized Fe-S cluster protein YjdI/CDGSH-type Zn-finger protein
MADRVYETDEIRVGWNSTLCLHTARCIRRAPDVFDSGRRPWVVLEGADPEDVADAVQRCPTGALTFEWLDPERADRDGAAEPAVVELQRNGPYYVRGPVKVLSVNGEVVARGPRVALCRCGGTKNAPFCDNTHRLIGFQDPPSGAGDARETPGDPRPPTET